MITADKLNEVNENLEPMDFKGKDYVEVNKRVIAFRKLCPDGTITTEIVSLENGTIIMKATVIDEAGKVLATGYAYEKEGNSLVNKTSYIENCETSAVGRALGFVGIGVKKSIASMEEVANAKLQQKESEIISKKDVTILANTIEAFNKKYPNVLDTDKLCGQYGISDFSQLTVKQYAQILEIIRATEEKLDKKGK